jgi:hypothetical protein
MTANTKRVVLTAGACLVSLVALSAQTAALLYQSRGNRSEGLRTIAVGGYDVELLSANVEFQNERPSGWADSVHLRFYLPADEKVFITVRQLRSRTTYYWLNNVMSAFKTRTVNEYDWPTGPVLRRLPELRLTDLGATVRLGQEQPSKSERVLPGVLFDAGAPGPVEAYRFVLKTNGRAKVGAAVYADEKQLFKRTADWEAANSPFTIRWAGGAEPEGWYRLVLSGYFANNTPLDKEIRFYHRPSLTR